MNISPTPEQVLAWREYASKFTNARISNTTSSNWWDLFYLHIAELAAQWGAEQAQQTTVEAERIMNGLSTVIREQGVEIARLSKQTTEEPELPEAVGEIGTIDLAEDGSSASAWIELHNEVSLGTKVYTAAHLHDHFQAKVRAATAQQSQDAKRLDWLLQKLFTSRWNGVIDSGSVTSWSVAPDYRHTTAMMIGNDFRSAIDAAMKGQQP